MIQASQALALVLTGFVIARATALFMELCAPAFLSAFAYGMYAKEPSAAAAKASLLTGAAVWFLWTAFVHRAESLVIGLSQFLFGNPALLGYPRTVIDPRVITLPRRPSLPSLLSSR